MGFLKNVSKSTKKITKKAVKQAVKQPMKAVKLSGKGLAEIPGLEGVGKSISKASDQTTAETNRGVDNYGDFVLDGTANYFSGGTYGAAMLADKGLDDPSQFTSRDALLQYGSMAAG